MMWSRRALLAASAAVLTAEDAADAGLPDVSGCGLVGGGALLPDMRVRVRLTPAAGDATQRIQAALDRAACVLRARGEYRIGGTLRIARTGCVLRGEGPETVLIATGT